MTTPSEPSASVIVDAQRLLAFVDAVMRACGCPPEDAAIGSQMIVRADLRGTHSHGVWFLPSYVEGWTSGGYRAEANIRIERETLGTAVIDADQALGHISAFRACEIAASKARQVGSATVLVRNSNHFGAAGNYALKLAEDGLIGIVSSNVTPIMAAPGAAGRVIGNQPVAYGAPAPDDLGPVVLDIALSTVAGARVMQGAARGESIPSGWIVDADGLASTDPADFTANGGALTPVAAHKGYGLAVLSEIMAGVLSGAAVTQQMVREHIYKTPSRCGHWVTAFDIAAFMDPAEFSGRLADLRREIHAARAASGSGAMLPGELEFAHEQAAYAVGVDLDPLVWNRLAALAADIDLADQLQECQISPGELETRAASKR